MSEQQHEAGAALDAEIAWQVFNLVPCDGWERGNFGSAGGPVVMKRCEHPADACYPTLSVGSVHGRVGGCPRYSSSIAAAWLVVERLKLLGWSFTLWDVPMFSSVMPGPMAAFRKSVHPPALYGEHDDPTVSGSGATPALAICRAALAALDAVQEARR